MSYWVRLKEDPCELSACQCEEAGGYVVEHDAGACGEPFELADGRRLENVERTEKKQGKSCVFPVRRDGDESDELAGGFPSSALAMAPPE